MKMKTLLIVSLILALLQIQTIYAVKQNLPEPARDQSSMNQSYEVAETSENGEDVLQFNGTFSWAYFDSLPQGANGEFSISFSIKTDFDDYFNDQYQLFRVGGIYEYQKIYYQNSKLYVNYWTQQGETPQLQMSNMSISADWNHFVFVYDGQNYKLYLNGEELQSDQEYSPIPLPEGSYVLLAHNIEGYIKKYEMYDVALDQSQVSSLSGGAAQANFMHKTQKMAPKREGKHNQQPMGRHTPNSKLKLRKGKHPKINQKS